jgi:hypothetical protein
MDVKPSINFKPEGLAVLNFAGMILASDEYSTAAINFPGSNCNWFWGTKGDFFITFNLYQDGVRVGSVSSQHINEKGYIELDFDTFARIRGKTYEGMFIANFWHSKEIPAELYLSHFHRASGSYMAYPAIAFTGDQLYPDVHATQLENTLFWPGIAENEHTETSIAIVNPYKVPFSYQAAVYTESGERIQTPIQKVRPFQFKFHKIQDLFADRYDEIRGHEGQVSLCVSAQYKVVTYVVIRNRQSGVITAIDHLHTYCLY